MRGGKVIELDGGELAPQEGYISQSIWWDLYDFFGLNDWNYLKVLDAEKARIFERVK